MSVLFIVGVIAAFVAGYAVGVRRPLSAARDRVCLDLMIGRRDGRPLGWRDAARFALLQPTRAWAAWRHRNDPPPPPPAPILINDKWGKK